MMTDAMRYRALEQVKEAGRRGLVVERGFESVTQMKLVEDGLLWQEFQDRWNWKFTLSPSGLKEIQRGRPVPHHGSGP